MNNYAKMNKDELAMEVRKMAAKLSKNDGSLFDRMMYAFKCYNKDKKSVMKNDLIQLIKEALPKLPAENTQEPVAENLVKKTANKSGNKKLQKSSKPEQKKTVSPRQIELAEMFQPEIDVEGVTYHVAHDAIKDMDDLYKLYEQDKTVLFAFYWTERHLKQFTYSEGKLPVADGKFDNDLDIAQAFYVSAEGKVCYAVSGLAEGAYTIWPEDLEEFDGMRMSHGIEYQIYID